MFITPGLRNVNLRHVFFHNGIHRSLKPALDFYNLRGVSPRTFTAGVGAEGLRRAMIFPRPTMSMWTSATHPDRHAGEKPALTDQ